MPSPQPTGSIKRPRIIANGSSPSFLGGRDQVVPSFQTFVKQTSPIDPRDALPPPRRASSTSPVRPRAPSTYTRRSSSVYSRSLSQFGSEASSWRSADFADEPLPPPPTLLLVAYSASTPQLVERQPTPPLLEPRAYRPLIHTPSPTASRVSTPSPPPQHKPSILLPLPPVHVQVPHKHLRTVSLGSAKAGVHSPGAVHLLPAELRAQTIAKSKSQEPVRMDSIAILAGTPPPQFPEPTTLVDHQGRRRTLRSATEQYALAYPFPNMSTKKESPLETFPKPKDGFDREDLSAALQQQRKDSQDKASQTLGVDELDNQRSRTRHRRPRNMDYAHYLPIKAKGANAPPLGSGTDAQMIAKEYHSLLTEQYRSASSSPDYYRMDSDESIKSHMKMVPKPLFQSKPPAKLPSTVTAPRKDSFWSPFRLSDDVGNKTAIGRSDSSDSSLGPNPFKQLRRSESDHERRSTSGSIPISPPTDLPSPARNYSPRGRPILRQDHASSARRGSDAYRASAFYPYVAPRKGRKAREGPSRAGTQSPPVPLLPADVVARRLRTPEASPTPSPQHRPRPSHASPGRRFRKESNGSFKDPFGKRSGASYEDGFRKSSNTSYNGRRSSPHLRLANAAAKYADLLTKPADLPEQSHYPAMQTATGTAPVSPHLLPSPVKSRHLGWSDQSRQSHDASRSLVALPNCLYEHPESPRTPQSTHIAAPARPSDERKVLKDAEMPRRKGSIFGVFDGWKESKAEKRREELKKFIRVVPNEPGTTAPTAMRRASTFWM